MGSKAPKESSSKDPGVYWQLGNREPRHLLESDDARDSRNIKCDRPTRLNFLVAALPTSSRERGMSRVGATLLLSRRKTPFVPPKGGADSTALSKAAPCPIRRIDSVSFGKKKSRFAVRRGVVVERALRPALRCLGRIPLKVPLDFYPRGETRKEDTTTTSLARSCSGHKGPRFRSRKACSKQVKLFL